jgi:hypothetical protein
MDGFYTTHMAAKYLGIAYSTFRWHIYTAKNIAPDTKMGHDFLFSQATLDDFKKRLQSNDFTLEEAAHYLGVSVSRMRDHVYNKGTVRPTGRRRRADHRGYVNTYSPAYLEAVRPIVTDNPHRGRPFKE